MPTFADLEYQGKKRKTRREVFLERMDGLIPWQLLEDRIRPFYPTAGRGRHPYPLSTMLRTHCVQLFYNLSDPGMEDLLYESEPVRRFVGLKLSGPLPDETTILNFRHLLEKNNLQQLDNCRCPEPAGDLALEQRQDLLLPYTPEGISPGPPPALLPCLRRQGATLPLLR